MNGYTISVLFLFLVSEGLSNVTMCCLVNPGTLARCEKPCSLTVKATECVTEAVFDARREGKYAGSWSFTKDLVLLLPG